MKNIAPKLTSEQYENNFRELRPAFTDQAAMAEASRCLYCYDSPCMRSCPTHIDVSTFIKKITTGNLTGSAKTIFSSNWVPLTCAKACPVEVLCEGACVYNEKGEKPIEIGRLQRHVIENYFNSGAPQLFEKNPSNGKKVAVVGSGPAGMSCSAELSLLGYDVTVYESSSVPGGLNTWGIAPYKMRREDSMKEVQNVKNLGVKILTNTTVGKDISADELITNNDAVFLGIGLGNSNALRIPGEDLQGVYGATEFIESVKKEDWANVHVGKRVAVIGAGNTAIDAATEAKRLGAEEVMIIYRRSSNDLSAYKHEYELAKKDGILFYFFTSPVSIVGKKYVEGLSCIVMEHTSPDKSGKCGVRNLPGSEFLIPCDMIIEAIGQEPQEKFVHSFTGVKMKMGRIAVNNETYQTANPKVFSGGDCANGGKEVVNAAYEGKMAAKAIHNFLNNSSVNKYNQYLAEEVK